MKLKDIKVGELYHAKVSGSLRVVKVVSLREVVAGAQYGRRTRGLRTVIDCVNQETGRTITCRSPQRLRPLPTTAPASQHAGNV